MDSKEIKKLVNLSGGKLIIGGDEVKNSLIVMKLDEYLKEIPDFKNDPYKNSAPKLNRNISEHKSELTESELLNRINADIAELKEKRDEELINELKIEEPKEKDEEPKYESIR